MDQRESNEHVARWCRSLVVSPGPTLDRFYKAQQSTADIVLFDLEDGVAATNRDQARVALRSIHAEQLRRPFGLRINSLRTADGFRDLETVHSLAIQPAVIVIPKVETPDDIVTADKILSKIDSAAWIWALIEGGIGVLRAPEIARASDRLSALTFGAADFCAELGIAMTWEGLLHARSQMVLAARTAGLGLIDSPTFALDDKHSLLADCQAAANMGFTGKVAVHPSQVAEINAAFSPDSEQVTWAQSVLQTVDKEHAPITRINGQMVGPPFVRAAKRILAQAALLSEKADI